MKRRIVRYLIVVFSIVAILFALVRVLKPSKKIDTYLAIGDYLSVSGKYKDEDIVSFSGLLGNYFIDNGIVKNVNTNYTSSGIDSAVLLEMINKDAYSGDDSGLVSLIKQSKYITISVGMNDIIDYIRFDSSNQKVIWNKDFVKRKLEIMKQNYYEIVDEIKNINDKVDIYLLGYYSPFNWVDEGSKKEVNEVFELLNFSVKEVSELMDVEYIDISSVSCKENMYSKNNIYLNQQGQNIIFDLIKSYYFS